MAFSPGSRLHLRLSVTDRCQLRCSYCRPPEGGLRQPPCHILRFDEIAMFVRNLQRSFDVQKVRLTGGEPLVRAGLPELVRMLAGLGIHDLAMTTNGQLLAPVAPELKAAGLHRVNVSLDSVDPGVFRRLSHGGDLSRTLAGIEAALENGLRPVKLNTVVMQGVNSGEVRDLVSFALSTGCELRFLELMPIGMAATRFDQWFVAAESVRADLSRDHSLTPLPEDSAATSRRYRIRDRSGREGCVGFVTPCTTPFCSACRRLRLTAEGRLVGCLARQHEGVGIRRLLASDDAWREGGGDAIVEQALDRRLIRRFERSAPMVSVGG